MYGSTERYRERNSTWPSVGDDMGASMSRKSDSLGIPAGRAARMNWRLMAGIGVFILLLGVRTLTHKTRSVIRASRPAVHCNLRVRTQRASADLTVVKRARGD